MSDSGSLSEEKQRLLERIKRGEVRLDRTQGATARGPLPPTGGQVATPPTTSEVTGPASISVATLAPPAPATVEGPVVPPPLAPPEPPEAASPARLGVQIVQAGGDAIPFFYQHGDWNGNAFYCHPLAQTLGPEQPFYLLDAYRMDDLAAPPPLETIAAEYVALIKQVRPSGPYLLGGFCNGALVIYEAARQLVAAGYTVAGVILIDPWSPLYRLGTVQLIHRLGRLFRASRAWELTTFLRIRHLYQRLNPSRKQRRADLAHLLTEDQRLRALWPSATVLRHDYSGVFSWMSAQYHPSKYPGHVAIFWNSEDPFYRNLWQATIVGRDQEVTEAFAQGGHLTLRTEHVEALGAQLRQIITTMSAAEGSPQKV